jgi:tetratricopeptide (TPR) repeat protein
MLCRYGDLLAHLGPSRFHQAERCYEAARAVDENAACAARGLGYLSRERGERRLAEQHLARAMKLDPSDYFTLLYRGENLSHGIVKGFIEAPDEVLDEHDAATLERARELLRRATRLRPEWAEAWVELGRTWGDDPNPPAEAVQSLERGFWMMPFRDDVALSVVNLYASLGRAEDVAAVAESPIRIRLDEHDRELLDGHLRRARWNSVKLLMEAGDTAGARAQLEALLRGGGLQDEELLRIRELLITVQP